MVTLNKLLFLPGPCLNLIVESKMYFFISGLLCIGRLRNAPRSLRHIRKQK